MAISELLCSASVAKRVQKLLFKNEFDLHENEHVGRTRFHLNGFAQRLVLKQRQKAARTLKARNYPGMSLFFVIGQNKTLVLNRKTTLFPEEATLALAGSHAGPVF